MASLVDTENYPSNFPALSSRSSIVLPFIFDAYNLLRIVFLIWYSKFHFFTYGYLVNPASFVEKSFPLVHSATFIKNEMSTYAWSVSVLFCFTDL